MKKILSSLLAGVMACVLAVACFACNTQKPSDKGADGKSAYQVWLDNGHSGTETDFLNWIMSSGEGGKSAYETFKEYYPDYKGTEQEWITAVASGDKCALFGHSFDDGVITIKPTIGKIGEKTYTCTVCNATKTEVVSKIDFTIGEVFELGEKVYVKFGSYPQTHVCDSELIAELNKLTETNERGYYTYNGNEYAKIIAKPCLYGSYTDKNGNTVYYTYSDGAKIINNATEWFLVEPIKWRVLEENDESIKVVSDLVLDGTSYYGSMDYRDVGEEHIAPNNYKYSTLREFLNNGFYNAAFTTAQQNAILITDVDNSASSTASSSNPYACENTQDKVFALSYRGASMYFMNNFERYLKITDYANADGVGVDLFGHANWWLRSPDDQNSDCAAINAIHGSAIVSGTWVGVVPAMQIRIA